ncbi:AMP-binding protein [Streptomyces sp. NBC_01789]|uniref:AMP-binding protein n=1 Tax=Streptomyces sp. NBC_01789 TaxID=2975941 RepID=UPI002254917F|nr:AMP-binding protein [Streptomyces sp. NBC_01789]MCX4445047.1 AMP-binding protein [Streptomyces sp. NBC_01789]
MEETETPATPELSVLRGPRAPYTAGDRIEVLLDRVAAEHPDAPALRHRDGTLTHAELVAAANRMAGALTARGIAPGDVVVVRTERTPDTVITLLGLLKAGAVYACAPVDWPEARCAQLVRQTGAAHRLTPHTIRGLRAASASHAPHTPAPTGTGTDAFCVFLTSGSSGTPKAALAPHRGVARTAIDVRRLHEGTLTSLQLSSTAWDVFALELWVTLINGGTCVLFDDTYLTGAHLRELVRDGVTVLSAATPVFAMLVDDDPGSLAGLTLLFVGGERLSADHVRRCLLAHPGLRLVNAYGPVENTINTTLWPARADRAGDDVPIGTPVTNTDIHLLDERRRVVPVGETGEIAVSGDGLSLGYLGSDTETARRFVTITDTDGAAVRAYLTGDLARIGPDGELLFAGRVDRQLKVRGLRIEPEEIERIVERVPGVGRCVVLGLPHGAPSATRTAAFYRAPDGTVPPARVREAVAEALPAGFVPDLWFAVDEFPLTANGKADQRALAALVADRESQRADGTPDEGHMGARAGQPDGDGLTEAVRAAASGLLGYPVGPEDDLFDRGATSLTAMRLATRLGRLHARGIGPADIFRARTPRRIAGLLADAPAAPAPDDGGATEADPGPETGYVPKELPFIFGSFWTAMRGGSRLDEAVVPVVYRLRGKTDPALLAAALDHLVARHEVLRVRFGDDPDRPSVRVLPASEARGLLRRHGTSADLATAEHAATTAAMRPFDLAARSPIRAELFPVAGSDDAVLAISAHHIFFDGWSARLFSEELASAYTVLADGRIPSAAPPPSYFRIIAAHREQHRELLPKAIWARRRRMADAPELAFPLGRGGLSWTGPAAEVPLAIDERLLADVGAAAATVHGTAMSVFYAAYVMLLRSLTGAPDPAVAVPVSGRYTEDESGLVGCMAGLLPLRLPATATSPAELAVAAAAELRTAMRPPLVPMGAVMPELPAGHRRHPLLQAYLLQEELPPATLRLGEADAELIRIPSVNAGPELTVELWPHPAVGGVLRYRTDAIPAADARASADAYVAHVAEVVRALRADG